jgi:four helix bundle protein
MEINDNSNEADQFSSGEAFFSESFIFYDNKNDFDTLQCWQLARELRKTISAIVKSFPEIEKYRLSDQLIRASRSVSDNIAEGYGRFHYKDKARFCFMARGSLVEVKNHLFTALDEEMIEQQTFYKLLEMKDNVSKTLNGYIRYLIEKSKQLQPQSPHP